MGRGGEWLGQNPGCGSESLRVLTRGAGAGDKYKLGCPTHVGVGGGHPWMTSMTSHSYPPFQKRYLDWI